MRLNKFDLNLLVALDALLREKSVTRAAERVFISQPAMSAALAKLREYFDNPLLVRVGRDMDLTPRARALREPVRQMLLDAQAVLGSQSEFDPAIERHTFTLLCPDNVSPWVMPGLLRRIERTAPGIRIEVERPSGSGLTKLAEGDVDLLLSLDASDSLPFPSLPESICSAFVVDLRYQGIVSSDNPVAHDQLTEEQLLKLPYILVRNSRRSSRVEEFINERYGVQLDIRAVTENVLELPFLVTGTPFLAITLEPLARVLKSSPRLRVLELPPDTLPHSRLDMLWHRSLQSDVAHTWLRSIVLEECSSSRGPLTQGA